ncbi:tetratricopeptide repeat (TPR)-like superfamily protein isoform X2 [Wolffia australiana]
MYSSAGKSQSSAAPTSSSSSSSGSLKNFEFDFGLGGKGSSRPLREQKPTTAPPRSTSSWTHQPATAAPPASRSGLSNPTSMAGDIFGKSWSTGDGGIGVRVSDPSLFGDLVGSALGKVPLKNAAPINSHASPGSNNWGNSQGRGFSSGRNGDYSSNSGSVGGGIGVSGAGQPMKQDPFGSLVDFGSKPSQKSGAGDFSAPNPAKIPGFDSKLEGLGVKPSQTPISAQSSGFQHQNQAKTGGFGSDWEGFGSKPSVKPSSVQSSGFQPQNQAKTAGFDFNFEGFGSKTSQKPISAQSSGFQHQNQAKTGGFGSNLEGFGSKTSQKPIPAKADPFDFSSGGFQPQNQPRKPELDAKLEDFGMASKISVDPLGDLFSSTTISNDHGKETTMEGNDWNFGEEFGGHELGGTTTELEGLPPPPAGVSSSVAIAKGSESYKQGQFADGIKWLSWAVVLLERSGDLSSMVEVLTCRASCYKEVGEIKKAIADCSKKPLDRISSGFHHCRH